MAGQPPKYNNCLDLDAAIEIYFDDCEENKIHPTVAGLAYSLGMSRRSITNYKNRDEFFPTIKKARLRIEAHLEQCLYGNSVTGVIFNLKNNFEWKDKTEQESYGKDGGPIQTENTTRTLFEFIVPECEHNSQ